MSSGGTIAMAMRTAIKFAAAGTLIPALLWGIIKSQDYGLTSGPVGEKIDQWAFELLIMLAPLFYHVVAILQDESLAAAYTIAFGTNAVLYAVIGAFSTLLLRSPWAYYSFVGLIVASMLIGTDSWFFYRWLNQDEFHLSLTLSDLHLRYFLLAASAVFAFFLANARKRT